MTRPRVGFILEQTLGHVTHAANLRSLVPADHRIDATFATVPFPATGLAAKLPGYSNWTVRAGLRARRQLTTLGRAGRLDALFVHTQVPAILLRGVMRRVPTIVSLDATPMQYDELGAHYGHQTGGRRSEHVKWRLNRECFRRAAAIVTWADWTAKGLVDGYGVDASKITVIPPGVDVATWLARAAASGTEAHDRSVAVRVLFVGGDFQRKGGAVLVDAVTRLRAAGVAIEADVVTRDDVDERAGIAVHHGLGPNTDALIALYRRADIFCLPTFGDCLPMVLSEAAAMGLPLVSTAVGAIAEIVDDGETGLLVPAGDVSALADAIGRLAGDLELRRRLGTQARVVATTRFDAATNAVRLVDVILETVRRSDQGSDWSGSGGRPGG